MEPILGEIKLFAGSFAPKGWFTSSEGQTLNISQYTAFVFNIRNNLRRRWTNNI